MLNTFLSTFVCYILPTYLPYFLSFFLTLVHCLFPPFLFTSERFTFFFLFQRISSSRAIQIEFQKTFFLSKFSNFQMICIFYIAHSWWLLQINNKLPSFITWKIKLYFLKTFWPKKVHTSLNVHVFVYNLVWTLISDKFRSKLWCTNDTLLRKFWL